MTHFQFQQSLLKTISTVIAMQFQNYSFDSRHETMELKWYNSVFESIYSKDTFNIYRALKEVHSLTA